MRREKKEKRKGQCEVRLIFPLGERVYKICMERSEEEENCGKKREKGGKKRLGDKKRGEGHS